MTPFPSVFVHLKLLTFSNSELGENFHPGIASMVSYLRSMVRIDAVSLSKKKIIRDDLPTEM